MSVTLAKLMVVVGSETAQAEKGLTDINKALGRSESIGKTALGVFSGALMVGAVRGVSSLAGEGVNAYASFERLGMSMNALAAREAMISGEADGMAEAMELTRTKAQGLLGTIEQVAIKSPFRQDTISATIQTAMGYGMASDMAMDLTQALVDLAAATGRGEEDMQRLGLGLGQVWAKGKLTGEEMRQLTNAGISVADVARAMKIPINEVADAIAAGEISARELIPALIDIIDTDFGGEAERQATSWAGLISTFEDLQEVNLREFFAGTLEELQPLAQELADTLGSPEFRAQVKATGIEIGEAVGVIVANGRELVAFWASVPDAVKGATAAFAGVFLIGPQIVGTMSSMVAGGVKLVQVYQQLGAGVGWFAVAQQGAVGLTAALTPVAAMVASITAAYLVWKNTSDKVEQGNQQVSNTWDQLIAELIMGGASTEQIMSVISAKSAQAQQALEEQGFAGQFLARVMGAEVAPSVDQVNTALKAGGDSYDEYADHIIDYLVEQGKVPEFERDAYVEMLTTGEAAQEVADELGVLSRNTYDSTVAIAKHSDAVEMTQKDYKAYQDAIQKAAAATNMQKQAVQDNLPVMMSVSDILNIVNTAYESLPQYMSDATDAQTFFNDTLGENHTKEQQAAEDIELLTQAYDYGIIGYERYTESLMDATQGTLSLTDAQRQSISTATGMAEAQYLAGETARESAASYWTLAESLKGASQAEIAKTLIDELTTSLEEGSLTPEAYNAAMLSLQDAFGISDEKSRALAEGLPLLTKAFETGLIPADNMDEAVKYLSQDAADGQINFDKLLKTFGAMPTAIKPGVEAGREVQNMWSNDVSEAFLTADAKREDLQNGLKELYDWARTNAIHIKVTIDEVTLPSTTTTTTTTPNPTTSDSGGISGPPDQYEEDTREGNQMASGRGGNTYVNVNQYNYTEQAAAVSNAEVERIRRQATNVRMGR